MKRFKWISWLIFLLIGFSFAIALVPRAPEKTEEDTSMQAYAPIPADREYTNKEDNEQCLKCHAKNHVEFMAEDAEKPYKQKMYTECIIDTHAYYTSNHWNFKCIDCHTDEYATFPHRAELRFEAIAGCMDCHGGDPQYEEFMFDQIDQEYQKSVHFKLQSESFSCWSCHDEHYYKLNARNRKDDIRSAIQYDNDICLSCHANTKKYQLIANKMNPSILEKHDWLPNQPNHFKHVRCIECHAEYSDTLIVSHNILPKDKAVKKCAECHSGNSQLMASLYKYQLEEMGAFKLKTAGLMDQPVIIGGQRNTLLKLIGNLALFGAIGAVLIHFAIRLYRKS